jgi:hypothetical protein
VRQTGEFQPELVASHRTELASEFGTDRSADKGTQGSACGWQGVSPDGTQYTAKGSSQGRSCKISHAPSCATNQLTDESIQLFFGLNFHEFGRQSHFVFFVEFA